MAVALATAGACANAMLTTERVWRLRSEGILHALGHSYSCRHRPLHTSVFTARTWILLGNGWILHGNGERDCPNKIDRGRKPEADDTRRSDRGGSAGPVDVSSRLKTKARPQQPHARTLLNRLAQAGRQGLGAHSIVTPSSSCMLSELQQVGCPSGVAQQTSVQPVHASGVISVPPGQAKF